MTEQDPDSNLKEQDYRKWVEGQSTEALEKELLTLELRRTNLQLVDPEMIEQVERQNEEAEAAEWEEELELMEPEKRAQLEAEMEPTDAEMAAEIEKAESEAPSWLTERVEVTQHLEAVRRELTARRNQELSKGEAASALAGAQKLPKPPTTPLLLRYRSQIKRGILVQLTQKPSATDIEICRGLDADGAVELPASWKKDRKDRLFEEAYMDSGRRHKVEIEISRVRADLRKRGFLDPR